MTLYLSEEDIRDVLTPALAIDAVERALAAHAEGRAFDVPRHRARLPGGHLHLMQAAAPELGVLGYKMYYARPGMRRTSQLHLIDRTEARLVAILEADWLGQTRTGAVTSVAVDRLARADAAVLGLFGTGRHARTQLESVCRVRALREVRVFGRDASRLQTFCDEMAPRVGVPLRPSASREATVRGADIVLTMTTSAEPLFDGRWIDDGTLVAAIGANALDRREIDVETVHRASRVVVDSREVARSESGDLLPAVEQGLVHWERLIELGEVVAGIHPGRTDDGQVVLFESHGMAIEDVYTGVAVLALARAKGLGVELPIG